MEYIVEYKETNRKKSSSCGYVHPDGMTRKQLIDFFGLHNPDVEWFYLWRVVTDENGNKKNVPM